jgi:hypothetical protein
MFAAGKAVSGAEATDAQFNYVTMLLHGDGTNGAQNNTFLDSSTNAFSITRNGNTTQGTFTPYGANWSNYFNGSSSLSVNVSGVAAGTSTFTFEAWVYLNAYPASDAPFYDTRSSNGASTTAMQFGVYSTGALKFYDGTETNLNGTVPLNQWVHIALVRNGSNVMTPYINGTATGTTVSSTRNFSDQYFWIGSVPGPASPYINAYLSNLRWVVGTAVYTSNFTPSTTPLTAITNTKILTCQSNRFVDNSSNAFAITVNSTPSVQRFSPFSPTTAYSTSVIGGSAYFDGTGDYLQTPSNAAFNFSATDCTLEFWYYGAGSGGLVFEFGSSTPDTAAMQCEFSSGTLTFKPIGASSSFFAIQTNAWNYVAAVKTGTTYYLYINGTRNTASTGTAASTGQIINIGARNGGSVAPITGFLSDFRVSNTARYTAATMTVPTAPLTAITNTSLLLSYTNAGILDNAMMNDLETVGNAQISTSVKKFGTGSLAFDGTGDYLYEPSTPILTLGSGDFTLEMWVNPTSLSGTLTFLLAMRPATTNGAYPVLYADNTGTYWYVSSSNRISGAVLSTSTWTHLAVARSGTSTKMFINGTQTGSTYTDSTNYLMGRLYIGASDYNSGTSEYLTGYIDDLRITKGVARYTASFTAPTAAFADKG